MISKTLNDGTDSYINKILINIPAIMNYFHTKLENVKFMRANSRAFHYNFNNLQDILLKLRIYIL